MGYSQVSPGRICQPRSIYRDLSTQIYLPISINLNLSPRSINPNLSTDICHPASIYRDLSTRIYPPRSINPNLSTEICQPRSIYRSLSTQIYLPISVNTTLSTETSVNPNLSTDFRQPKSIYRQIDSSNLYLISRLSLIGFVFCTKGVGHNLLQVKSEFKMLVPYNMFEDGIYARLLVFCSERHARKAQS